MEVPQRPRTDAELLAEYEANYERLMNLVDRYEFQAEEIRRNVEKNIMPELRRLRAAEAWYDS